MTRHEKTVTDAAEHVGAMAAPAAGQKRPWHSTDLDEISKEKLDRGYELKALLNLKHRRVNASPGSSCASTRAQSSFDVSPRSMFQSPMTESRLDYEIPSREDVDAELDKHFANMSDVGLSPFATTGSPEVALDLECYPGAPPTIIASPSPAPSAPSATVLLPLPSSLQEQIRSVEQGLLEPEPPREVVSIGTGPDDNDVYTARWGKLAQDGFDLRCAEGQKFARSPEAKSEAYKSLNIANKAEFRKEWAKKIYDTTRKVKVKSTAWTKIDISKGTYMSFSVIVREEGNDDAAVKAATHYVTACQFMGGVWKKWNLMTKRWEFLYMRQEVHEIFEQSWKMFEEQQQGGAGPPAPGPPAPVPPALGAKAATGLTEVAQEDVGKQTETDPKSKRKNTVTGSTEADAGKGKAKAKAKASGVQPKAKASDGKKTPFEVALQDAIATKKAYMTVTSKIALVTEQINSNRTWLWARGHYQDELRQTCDPIRDLATTGFARLFLMQELKDVKKEYTQNDLLTHTVKFCSDFDDVLGKAQKLLIKLITMQSESMK
jgi:hypothetical protein